MVLALAVLVAAPNARAAYDPVGSGTTKLVLDQRFSLFLAANRIEVRTVAGARRSGSVFALPISSGRVDPRSGKGEVEQEGSLVLANARKRVPIRDLVVKTAHTPLVGKVGGSQLKLATASSLRFRRRGFGAIVSAKPLRLTAKVATRLNKKLRPAAPFVAGQAIGKLISAPQPSLTAILVQGRASLALDAAFKAKLDQRFVSVNPISPAELAPGPTLTFPILGGALAPDLSSGLLKLGGSIELLQLGAGQIFWAELEPDLDGALLSAEADLEPSPPFAGRQGPAPLLAAGSGTLSADPSRRTLTAAGIPLTLEAATADSLNAAFDAGGSAFEAGETVGALSFTAQGQ